MKEMWSDQLARSPELFRENSIVGLFRLAAAYYPERIALATEQACLSYEELEYKSNKVAREMQAFGIQPGEIVALKTGRTAMSVLACIAAWKVGCAYVFLDSNCPPARNCTCMEECAVRLSITEDFIMRALVNQSGDFFEECGTIDRLAVVVYTSGSTGKPKGVKISQRNLTATISNFASIPFHSSDRYCSFSSLMFIASVYDIALSLCIGATLYLLPKALRKHIKEIAQFYVDHKITVTFLPPHMAMKYIQIDEGSPLRMMLVGSEPVRNLSKRPYEIVNVYASSEACAIVCHYNIRDSRTYYPIGVPVPSLKTYVVDERGQPVPEGEVGELWLSGPQISSGYLHRPNQTAKQFIPNPFCDEPEYRMLYQTGDLVCWNEEGEMEYRSRKDNMVKVRGYRIELAGVERHMLSFESIREACCVVHTDEGGTNLLFGYYVADRPVDHKALREHLQSQLPNYMVPMCLIACDDFPRTMTGKVARKEFVPPAELNDRKKLAELYY